MNSSASQRMTKSQVCKYLGKSKRTIEGYVTKGLLGVGYIDGPNGNVAVFDRAAVRKFKTDWASRYEALAEKAVVPAGAIALRPRPVRPAALPAPATDPVAPPIAVTPVGHWLDLDGYAKFSNLPKSWLVRQAREGVPWAVNVSSSDQREVWRFAWWRAVSSGSLNK